MTEILPETQKKELLDSNKMDYQTYHFGDTDFQVPHRYVSLSARGIGAQGAVW